MSHEARRVIGEISSLRKVEDTIYAEPYKGLFRMHCTPPLHGGDPGPMGITGSPLSHLGAPMALMSAPLSHGGAPMTFIGVHLLYV